VRLSINMPKQADEIQVLSDEFAKIFDAYRERIDEISRRTQSHLTPGGKGAEPVTPPKASAVPTAEPTNAPEPPEDEASTAAVITALLASVNPQPGIVMPKSKPVMTIPSGPVIPLPPPETKAEAAIPEPIRVEVPVVKEVVVKESEVILRQARRQADKLLAEAEESIRKEAKKKTQAQVDKVLAKANKEAEETIAKAARHITEEREQISAQMKLDGDKALKDITETCRRESRERAAQVIAETRDKAAKMITDVTAASEDIGRQLNDIISRAKATVAEFETKMQAETGEFTRTISEAHTKLLTLTLPPKEPEMPVPAAASKNKLPVKNPTLTVHLKDTKADRRFFHTGLFAGRMEMKSAGALDYRYVKALKKTLGQYAAIRYLEESASEKELSLQFEVVEPQPLLDVLGNVPMVEQVLPQPNDDILVVFRNAET
jgi:hypothetical protein